MPKTKVEYWFDPFEGISTKKVDKKAALKEISDYLAESILSSVQEQKSPVTGAKFQKLSPSYAKEKQKEVGNKRADLELHGDMMASLIVKPYKGGVLVTVPSDQQGKADGHNNWTSDNLPLRQFIPKKSEDQTFTPKIMKEIQNIIDDFTKD